jgi:hypothetical protein
MVKIQSRLEPKSYLKNKLAYFHERNNLEIPSRFRLAIRPFKEEDFNAGIILRDGDLTIFFTTCKIKFSFPIDQLE